MPDENQKKIYCSFSFQLFWSGYQKELKELGSWDTVHNDEIPKASLIKLMELLAKLQKVMEADKEKDAAKKKEWIQKLPVEYINCYHKLLQYAAMMIICMHFARRGREGTNFDQMIFLTCQLTDLKKK